MSDQAATPGFLVWLQGMRGPELQLWAEMFKSIDKNQRAKVLKFYPLKQGEWALPFHVLARLYPAPGEAR